MRPNLNLFHRFCSPPPSRLRLLPFAPRRTIPPAGDKAAYLVLGFNDGTAVPSFGFQFNYPTAQTGTVADLLAALTPPAPQRRL